MVYRVFVEKKKGLRGEGLELRNQLRSLLQIKGLDSVRVFNRYDVEGIDKQTFERCKTEVFSEPQVDNCFKEVNIPEAAAIFAVEYLPGQFDQRADSAAQCIQLITQGERPRVRTAKVYALYGELSEDDIAAIKHQLINPVECREASMDKPETLEDSYDTPADVAVLEGFRTLDEAGLRAAVDDYGLAMDVDDLRVFCDYFCHEEMRDPTITELRVIDTYWSDHCRHTTFHTTIDDVSFEDPLLQRAWDDYLATREELGRGDKPIDLMDVSTTATRWLRSQGKMDKFDESEEVNACTIKVKVRVDDRDENWLLLFKNETHNHPTEIEPFGGAATCIGGAIRDPLAGRGYVYAAMRVTGAANPRQPASETLAGKLPQRTIVTEAANGYSSYGNQIGLATGIVDELYHPGYAAKHMEVGAVIGAAPVGNVRREKPVPGDRIILLGGKTGRDGCGGATGSSKSHTVESLSTCGAEVQKGNAPEEKKIQRLFRKKEVTVLIKRCNDFGAGGVSVACGELADGLQIDLDAVPRKYEGLDGTELAISESQERMAVVVAEDDVDRFLELAAEENLEATVIAQVTAKPRLTMLWRGKTIVNLSREFLNCNGAEKHISISTAKAQPWGREIPTHFVKGFFEIAFDLNVCSKRGLAERFDSTIGAGTVLMPFGGREQLTPIQAMAHKLPAEDGEVGTCSIMSWAYNPEIAEKSPYHAAYLAVVESVAKLIATGATFEDIYLSFQEYFGKVGHDPARWGVPLSALLGAYTAQKELGVGSIGGKDSMSGTFEDLDVPPTLISFAVTTDPVRRIISPEFKEADREVVLVLPRYDADGLPSGPSLKATFEAVAAAVGSGAVEAVWSCGYGGIAEGLMKMGFGNMIGIELNEGLPLELLFGYHYGAFIAELAIGRHVGEVRGAIPIGRTIDDPAIRMGTAHVDFEKVMDNYHKPLRRVYPFEDEQKHPPVETYSFHVDDEGQAQEATPAATHIDPPVHIARPKVLIPAFPGTNCEYDTARAFEEAGADPEVLVIRNLTPTEVSESVERMAEAIGEAQIVFLPGGFSAGDEPDGSAKFIASFFRNEAIAEKVDALLTERDGLMGGICNGFQALIKLGLLPNGKIAEEAKPHDPTLTFNTIGRHQSKLVRVRVATDKSPWLTKMQVGEVYTMPISHGEGRFIAEEKTIEKLAKNGQIASQYVDAEGNATSEIQFNPNGSTAAIEGIISPDGRVLGKMGHAERHGKGLYKNVEGNYDFKLFESAVEWFK
ncbi:MAG: phosphoribosylformylglycinamidine synthase, partial [Coriobacteriaceae bacterium]|nr:phosphoribosylformylglycinamidine synthase [Coriobacteriaceae bacterium]